MPNNMKILSEELKKYVAEIINSRTINGKALSSDITLTASDLSAVSINNAQLSSGLSVLAYDWPFFSTSIGDSGPTLALDAAGVFYVKIDTDAISVNGPLHSSPVIATWPLSSGRLIVDTELSNYTPSVATSAVVGLVKPDNNTITVDANGVLSANTTLSVISLNEFSEWTIDYCSPCINIENITYNGSWIVSGTYTGVQGKYDDSQIVWPEAGTPFSNNTGFTNESALEIYDNGLVELYNFHLTRSIVPVASGYVLGNQTDKPLAPLSVVSDLTAHTSNSDIHFTANERTKLSGIATGAQVNVLEGVKVGTTALTPTDKVVTVPLATSSNVGVVKPDGTTITVDSSGTLSANVPTITMRVYDED